MTTNLDNAKLSFSYTDKDDLNSPVPDVTSGETELIVIDGCC